MTLLALIVVRWWKTSWRKHGSSSIRDGKRWNSINYFGFGNNLCYMVTLRNFGTGPNFLESTNREYTCTEDKISLIVITNVLKSWWTKLYFSLGSVSDHEKNKSSWLENYLPLRYKEEESLCSTLARGKGYASNSLFSDWAPFYWTLHIEKGVCGWKSIVGRNGLTCLLCFSYPLRHWIILPYEIKCQPCNYK